MEKIDPATEKNLTALIYKHHSIITTDSETGKSLTDFGTVMRVAIAYARDYAPSPAEQELRAEVERLRGLLDKSRLIVRQQNLNTTASEEGRSATISRLIDWLNECALAQQPATEGGR